ncbi:FAD-dependent oxidoreductase [Streptomyces sp. Da 82-17]|uniref:FAD-binding oxidoreductase n=1 Tax=Streptomyces sp. Da 82-17 TaxID=3377116 RepID=UPI0038D37ED4
MTVIGERDAHVVALPGEPEFTAATEVFNLAAPLSPAAAVTARTVDEVRAALDHARAAGLFVRVHTTGHGAGTAHPMERSLLIRTRMREPVTVDVRRGLARIPAGSRWADVVEAAAPHGLAVAHGSSPTVGAVGYLLRGGLSFYGRSRGVAANGVRAVELVTADGELRRVDAESDPELLWALRGGGGGLGVVTAVETELFPATEVRTGSAFWPFEHAERLLSLWLAWCRDAPRTATTTLQVMNLPDVTEIPPALRAGPVVCVDGAVLGEGESGAADAERTAADLLGPLRATAPPLLDTWEAAAPPAVLHTHMDPTDPLPMVGDHMLLDELGDAGAAEFLRVTGPGSGSPLISAELRQLGGAFAEPSPTGGALSHIAAPYAYLGAGVPQDEADAGAIRAHCARVRAALDPWNTGRTAPTLVEDTEQPQGHLTDEQREAVDRVRERVDPLGLFRGDIAPQASARRQAS